MTFGLVWGSELMLTKQRVEEQREEHGQSCKARVILMRMEEAELL
jgi:hypothetical protein